MTDWGALVQTKCIRSWTLVWRFEPASPRSWSELEPLCNHYITSYTFFNNYTNFELINHYSPCKQNKSKRVIWSLPVFIYAAYEMGWPFWSEPGLKFILQLSGIIVISMILHTFFKILQYCCGSFSCQLQIKNLFFFVNFFKFILTAKKC